MVIASDDSLGGTNLSRKGSLDYSIDAPPV